MKPVHHAKVQLQHAALACRHVLLLRRIDDEGLRLRSRRIKIPNLLRIIPNLLRIRNLRPWQRSSQRQRKKHARNRKAKPHHCPPAIVAPEAIVLLM
jgi:hypothetical protein